MDPLFNSKVSLGNSLGIEFSSTLFDGVKLPSVPVDAVELWAMKVKGQPPVEVLDLLQSYRAVAPFLMCGISVQNLSGASSVAAMVPFAKEIAKERPIVAPKAQHRCFERACTRIPDFNQAIVGVLGEMISDIDYSPLQDFYTDLYHALPMDLPDWDEEFVTSGDREAAHALAYESPLLHRLEEYLRSNDDQSTWVKSVTGIIEAVVDQMRGARRQTPEQQAELFLQTTAILMHSFRYGLHAAIPNELRQNKVAAKELTILFGSAIALKLFHSDLWMDGAEEGRIEFERALIDYRKSTSELPRLRKVPDTRWFHDLLELHSVVISVVDECLRHSAMNRELLPAVERELAEKVRAVLDENTLRDAQRHGQFPSQTVHTIDIRYQDEVGVLLSQTSLYGELSLYLSMPDALPLEAEENRAHSYIGFQWSAVRGVTLSPYERLVRTQAYEQFSVLYTIADHMNGVIAQTWEEHPKLFAALPAGTDLVLLLTPDGRYIRVDEEISPLVEQLDAGFDVVALEEIVGSIKKGASTLPNDGVYYRCPTGGEVAKLEQQNEACSGELAEYLAAIRGFSITKAVNTVFRNIGVEHDLTRGKGSHSILSFKSAVGERMFPLSKRMRESDKPITPNFFRAMCEGLGIPLEEAVRHLADMRGR